MKTSLITIAVTVCMAIAGVASAQPPTAASPNALASANTVEGEIKKVDLDGKRLTLKHGDIKNLGMPGMTMVFRVADPKMLEGLKAGDTVRFTADRVDGALTVTAIEPKI
jgi:Cu/Ag efflux protein CusF